MADATTRVIDILVIAFVFSGMFENTENYSRFYFLMEIN